MTPAPKDLGSAHSVAIVQGEHRVSRDPDTVLMTILGSCVAACIRDPVAGVGGLNHFLLPGGGAGAGGHLRDPEAVKYGLHAMELLINSLIRAGAQRHRLEAKLFGGACMQAGLPDIGRKNARFAEDFLRAEGIAYVGGSLGGTRGRKIRYWPVSGLARQLLLSPADVPTERLVVPPPRTVGEVELF